MMLLSIYWIGGAEHMSERRRLVQQDAMPHFHLFRCEWYIINCFFDYYKQKIATCILLYVIIMELCVMVSISSYDVVIDRYVVSFISR